ncbi:transglycosylase SLT domain-containing protein [Sulfobacillus thermosulfidooxidans]|uniref:transglycosylase SLT domain-containing protein n=1 Tax=Sulfobacillus thermosulfidooxidans TaxID=28034 RepID=UPI0003008C8A|nr:transglycosylase SLT domain-containing protein [Sulfobacillus thermosulfidooxidans]
MVSRWVKRRVLWWVLGALASAGLPLLAGVSVLFLVVLVVLMVIGGLAYHVQHTPPPLPTQAVYASQWLTLVQHVETANGWFTQYPAVLWIAALAASSGAFPLDRTAAGGYGLFDLPNPATMGHPLVAMNAFAADWRAHAVPGNLQQTLNAVGLTLAPTHPGWATAVRQAVDTLEQGPEVAAWPNVMTWSVQTTPAQGAAARFGSALASPTVAWDYPETPITILATASAPVGNPYAVAWTPPYTVCIPPPPHSTQKPACHVVTDQLSGRDLEGPLRMTVKTTSGQLVPMEPVSGGSDGVYPHAVLWQTVQPVRVNAQHPVTITAYWADGVSVSTTLPGSGFGATADPVGIVPPPGNPQDLQQIWQHHQVAFQAAAQATGVPVSLLVSEAYAESRGVDYPYLGSGAACGLFQMFSPGSFTAYAPAGSPPSACADPVIEAQAAGAFFAALHAQFGSWRLALAAYYGGPGTVLSSGVRSGMAWTQAAPRLNWVPAPGAGNTETMSAYAEASYANAVAFAQIHHLPAP